MTITPQSGVDGERRDLSEVQELLDDCVHCGFCLPACPTYSLWGQEMDSPRGRIYLMGEVLSGCPIGGAPLEHFDRCLSCMACVSACPSGVRYGEIIEAARVEIERTVQRPRAERWARAAIFGLFPYPRRLRVARVALAAAEASGLRAVLQRPGVSARLPALFRVMESVAPPVSRIEVLPVRSPSAEPRRGVVGLLTGCVQSVFFSQVNSATARVLAAEGFEVVVPQRQGCCGALSWHTGRKAEAARFAKQTVDAFKSEGVEYVVVNAAGCGSAMKEYTSLLAGQRGYEDDAAWLATHTRDLSELLAAAGAGAASPCQYESGLPRCLPLGPRARHPRPAQSAAPGDPGVAGIRDRGRVLLRLRRDLQPGGAGSGQRTRGPQGGRHRRH